MARDLGMPDEKVRVDLPVHGRQFGNKNQNQDADLITAMLAKQAGAPVKLEFSRKDDFIGVHGRWPTVQYYKVGVDARRHAESDPAARLQRHGPYRKNSGAIGGIELYKCAHIESIIYPVYTNKTSLGKFPRSGISAGILRHRVDDGRRRVQAEDGSGRIHR